MHDRAFDTDHGVVAAVQALGLVEFTLAVAVFVALTFDAAVQPDVTKVTLADVWTRARSMEAALLAMRLASSEP